ncbi:primase homolog protein-like isoform X1 [Salvia splendens]|uniref:primase homolog protein-like isoform X1 n=1 Tax=Salvia splendens TaxID=180675 RepID=UPI001C25D417|nr:primase homolog protein-like isoform X1 [Salvia splendens]
MPPTALLHRSPPPPPCLVASNTWLNLLSLECPNTYLPYSAELVSGIPLKSNGFRCFSHPPLSKPTAVDMDVEKTDSAKLKPKIEALGVKFESCTPGQFDLLYCPKCKGGRSIQRTLSFHISQSWSYAIWRCFDLQCGWAGQVFADNNKENPRVSRENLRLEPLDNELLGYFAERMISKETLQRNNVMQVVGGKKIIAFPYRRNGQHVGCKYRTLDKRFWQGRNTEKMLYGIDDIVDADEIIIVEGEIDKLSIEEAGYCNCVSVPGGAPQTVSVNRIPSKEKDTAFQYLWNCIDYFEKASRIILATDGDAPGQALAEELARRLGKERCWRVHWQRKDESSSFKDANEVLKSLGADALRAAIDKAELY